MAQKIATTSGDKENDGTRRPKVPTMKHIAEEAKVSIKTVSRVINNDPAVKEATRGKVMDVAGTLGYRPNTPARTLVTGRSKTIGLLISDIGNYFFSEIVKGVQVATEEEGYSLLLCDTGENPDTELRCVDLLLGHKVDGLILSSSRLKDDQISNVAKYSDVVLCNRTHPDEKVRSVCIEDNALHLATEHLIELGHRHFGYIGGPVRGRAAWMREEGCREVLARHGFEKPIVASGFPVSIEGGYEAMNWILDVKPEVSAIVTYNDMLAIGAMKAVQARGLKVPEDISVVGFDDLNFAAHTNPPLTTVSVPIFRFGYKAAQLLFGAIRPNGDDTPHSDVIKCHLVIRSSTGKVKA